MLKKDKAEVKKLVKKGIKDYTKETLELFKDMFKSLGIMVLGIMLLHIYNTFETDIFSLIQLELLSIGIIGAVCAIIGLFMFIIDICKLIEHMKGK